ncbi:transcription repressor OFP17-like [Tasmannia lanceolata]|uniref:transcription repressor OFP17-like n=1 Tax=Tasmannia lanceolata TaxID=3420 RepID=UPI0040628873
MQMSLTFKSKLLKPCRKLLQIFKFPFKRPILRPFSPFRKLRRTPTKTTRRRRRFCGLISAFRSSEKMDGVGELRSLTEVGREQVLFPSPLTPAYVKMGGDIRRMEVACSGEVEDACQNFENYLVEMIVEEGKLKDLRDVEELLYCWKNLRCPVFHDLVCRFYGELCKDLFSGQEEDGDDSE